MDFDRYLTKVQSSLRRIEINLGIKLDDLTRENSDDVGAVVLSFSDFLKELNPGIENLRRIHLYLLLNSEFESLYSLHNDANFCHLFNITPKLSTFLYFELMNNTEMYKYVGEVIMFCPEVLVVEVLKCISANMRLFNAEHANNLLYSIYEGMYHKICTFHEKKNQENIKQKYVKILQNLFEFSIFEIVERTDWGLEKRQCFFGRYIKMLLNLIEKCIYLFNSKHFYPNNDIYTMKIEFDYTNWNSQVKEQNWPIYCLQIMICKCKKMLKEISVDIYLALVEEDEGDTGKTLQLALREAAYTCRESLRTISSYEDKIVDLKHLVTGLNDIALKPKSEDDEFDQADTDTIAKNMKDPVKTRWKWLRSYLNINNILLDERCINDLKVVIQIFTKETTILLISKFVKHFHNSEIPVKHVESYKEIIVNCVKNLKTDDQLEILDWLATTEFFGTDILRRKKFNQFVTETLNKTVNKSENMEMVMQNIIILAMESGRELVSFLLDDCLKGVGLCDMLVQILLDVPILTKYTVSSTDSTPLCLNLIVQHFNLAIHVSVEERDTLIHLIMKLSWYSIINGKDFIISYLIPSIQTSVPERKWKDVDICLDILSAFIDGRGGEHVIVHDGEIIAFLAHLLNRSRLQPHQFTIYSGQVVQKTSAFLFTLTNKFLQNKNDITDRDGCWLRDIAKTMSPLTHFPMRKLWLSSGLELPPDPNNMLTWSKQYLDRQDLLNMDDDVRSKFVIQLCKILPLLCQSEWTMIGYQLTGVDRAAHCIAVFHILADGLLVLNQLPVVVGNIACSGHLISGFTAFFKAKVIHALKHSDREACLTVLNKQVLLINDLSPELIRIRLPALVTVLQDITDTIIDKGRDKCNSDLLSTVATVKEPQIQSMLSVRLIKTLSKEIHHKA